MNKIVPIKLQVFLSFVPFLGILAILLILLNNYNIATNRNKFRSCMYTVLTMLFGLPIFFFQGIIVSSSFMQTQYYAILVGAVCAISLILASLAFVLVEATILKRIKPITI